MCGIWGWQWRKDKLPTSEQRTIVACILGLRNQTRGTDSYGWHDCVRDLSHKGLGEIAPVARKMATAEALMGHTRHATQGDKTIGNAHPFRIGRIVGAHNGIISNHYSLNSDREKANLPKRDVDSMHIFDALNESDAAVEALTGYGAIEWTDTDQKGLILMAKLSDRGELGIAMTPYGTVWSSDDAHLKDALRIAGIKYQLIEVKPEQVYYTENGKAMYWIDRKLKLGSYSGPGWQGGGVYGSTLTKRDDIEQRWVDFLERNQSKTTGNGGENVLPFRGSSKKARKRLIKERNEALRKSRGTSSSAQGKNYSYKDLCACGAWVGDGEKHQRWCEHWEPVRMVSKTTMCTQCGAWEGGEGSWKEHQAWCSNYKKVSQAPVDTKELRGIFAGDPPTWVCPECYNEPQVWDQHCPSGHGRVLGNPKEIPDAVG